MNKQIRSNEVRSLAAVWSVMAALGLLAASPGALAAPSQLAPADGATVDSTRPTFSWTWDTEASSGVNGIQITVSDRLVLDADGRLDAHARRYYSVVYSPNSAAGESENSYRPPADTAMPAGTYYWQVHQLNTVLPTVNSSVWSVVVPARTLIRDLSCSASNSGALITLRTAYTVNAPYIRYRIEWWRGGRRRGLPAVGTWSNPYRVGAPSATTDQFSPQRLTMRAGERYTAKVRITASGVSHTRNVAFVVRR